MLRICANAQNSYTLRFIFVPEVEIVEFLLRRSLKYDIMLLKRKVHGNRSQKEWENRKEESLWKRTIRFRAISCRLWPGAHWQWVCSPNCCECIIKRYKPSHMRRFLLLWLLWYSIAFARWGDSFFVVWYKTACGACFFCRFLVYYML